MSWHEWFPGEKPGKVGQDRLFAEAARRALREVGAQIGWLPSGTVVRLPDGPVRGFAQFYPQPRVYAPEPKCVSDLATVLHECGHIATVRVASYLELEQMANTWALGWWRRHDLPDAELAEFCLQQGYEAATRHQLALDNTPLRQIELAVQV